MKPDVTIIVDGHPIKQHGFEGRLWVEARKGKNYEIRIRNNTLKRQLAIISVDGLSVLDGQPANNSSGGYVLNPFSSYTVKGFRVSNEEVNLFEFSAKGESYAVKSPTGEQSSVNCGVIAVRIIDEKEPDYVPYASHYRWNPNLLSEPLSGYNRPRTTRSSSPVKRRLISTPFDNDMPIGSPVSDNTLWMEQERGLPNDGVRARSATYSMSVNNASPEPATLSFDMGTKFSEETVADKVVSTEFKQGKLYGEINIYYASRKALEKMGIEFEPKPKVVLPQGFKDGPYCQRPR